MRAARARQHRVEADGEVVKGYQGQDIASTVVKFAKENPMHTIFVARTGPRELWWCCWGPPPSVS
jgi:hypothetical protein